MDAVDKAMNELKPVGVCTPREPGEVEAKLREYAEALAALVARYPAASDAVKGQLATAVMWSRWAIGLPKYSTAELNEVIADVWNLVRS